MTVFLLECLKRLAQVGGAGFLIFRRETLASAHGIDVAGDGLGRLDLVS